MKAFKRKLPEVPYRKRVYKSLRFYGWIDVAAYVLIILLTPWLWWAVLPPVLLFFIAQYVWMAWKERYYITGIKLYKNSVYIAYTDKDRPKEIKGLLSDFKFEKKGLITTRFRLVYLKVFYKGRPAFRQHETISWYERDFDELLGDVKRASLQTK